MFSGNANIAQELGLKGKKIDIHSHIIPNSDDGARNIEEAVELGRMIKKGGTDCIIWTPHHNFYNLPDSSKERIDENYLKFAPLIEKETGLKIIPGSEFYLSYPLPDTVIPLGNSQYVLFETNVVNMPVFLKKAVFELQVRRYTLILAHLERYQWLFPQKKKLFKKIVDFSLFEELEKLGVLFQINYTSLINIDKFKFLKTLLDEGRIHFLGSDKHRTDDERNVINWEEIR